MHIQVTKKFRSNTVWRESGHILWISDREGGIECSTHQQHYANVDKCIKNALKKALISGITGQDGSYLVELLLEKDMKYTALNEGLAVSTLQGLIIYIKIPMKITRASYYIMAI